jgi:hypothetical protein
MNSIDAFLLNGNQQAPFGGEQFLVPQQERQMKQFFSVFFFAMTVGNMISTGEFVDCCFK